MEKIRVREVHFGKPIKGLEGNVITYCNETTHRCDIEFSGSFFVIRNTRGSIYVPTANVSHFYIPEEDMKKPIGTIDEERIVPAKRGRPFAIKPSEIA